MRLHVILDLPGIDAAQVDPWELADQLLHGDLNTFEAGALLGPDPSNNPSLPIQNPEDLAGAFYVTAEWGEPEPEAQALRERIRHLCLLKSTPAARIAAIYEAVN